MPFHSACTDVFHRFLHAKLQLEALRYCINLQDVEDTLEEFPTEIEEIYMKTWDRIIAQPSKYANLAKLVFLWILHVDGEITIDMLRKMVSTCPTSHLYQPKRLVPESLILSACCGLVTIDEKTRRVRLIRELLSVL